MYQQALGFGLVLAVSLPASAASAASVASTASVNSTASTIAGPRDLRPPKSSASNSEGPASKHLSDRRLAAKVIFGCTDSRNTATQRSMARMGVGGIVLLGSNPPANLKTRLRSVQRASPNPNGVMIASDEEGGAVQRLAPLIYRLPPAETMGTWSDRRVRKKAKRYAARMRKLGVGMSLAPVADLRVRGSYMDRLNRAFSTSPKRVGRKASAWAKGIQKARVVPVVKHWPGHGHAVDTHRFAARVPSLAKLRRADMRPFDIAFSRGVRAVMVAHVQAKGLTKAGEPATQSKRALRVLRKRAGPDAVIVTDSLSMAAASSARGLNNAKAVVASLRAGADWAMVCTDNLRPIVKRVKRAIKRGKLSRAALRQSAQRIDSLN